MATAPILAQFPALVRLIQNGEPVEASVANRAPASLARRTEYLLQLFNAIGTGQLIAIPDQPILLGTPIGTPVYWTEANTRFEPAQVASIVGALQGAPDQSSYVAGVITAVPSPGVGTVALYGIIKDVAVSSWSSIGVVEYGHYYLASATSGMLVQDPGPYGIYVGQYTVGNKFILRPEIPQRGTHVHYRFELLGSPAIAAPTDVNAPTVGQDQQITTPSTAVRGWLPASTFDPLIFQVPAGAAFGYNIDHPDELDMKAVWPPQPLEGATLVQNGLVLDASVVQVNSTGIWWMSAAYGQAPWPVDFNPAGTAEDIRLWFSMPMVGAAGGTVSRLSFHEDSVLTGKLVVPSGAEGTSGDLRILFERILQQSAAMSESTTAVKEIVGDNFKAGPVTTRVRAGSGVSVNGSAGNAADGFYGELTLSVQSASDRYADPASVILNNGRQDIILDTSVVVLPSGRTANPVFRFNVSPVAPSGNVTVTAWLYSTITGTTPADMVASYRLLPAAATDIASVAFTGSLTGLASKAVVAGRYIPLTLGVVAGVTPGAILDIRLSRNGVTDGFVGDLGLLRLRIAVG